MEAISACCIKMCLNRRPDDEAPKQQAARGDAFERRVRKKQQAKRQASEVSRSFAKLAHQGRSLACAEKGHLLKLTWWWQQAPPPPPRPPLLKRKRYCLPLQPLPPQSTTPWPSAAEPGSSQGQDRPRRRHLRCRPLVAPRSLSALLGEECRPSSH